MGWKAAVFVEGNDDENFFRCYLKHLGFAVAVGEAASGQPGANEGVCVFRLDGGIDKLFFKGKAKKNVIRQLNKADMGLFVLDANNSAGKIKEKFAEFKGGFPSSEKMELFLMPNNKEAGALEGLLRQMAVKKDAFDCMEVYKKCLLEKGFEGSPDKKGEFFAYCEANGFKPEKADYADGQFWNLESDALAPLRAFLMEHFGEGLGGFARAFIAGGAREAAAKAATPHHEAMTTFLRAR